MLGQNLDDYFGFQQTPGMPILFATECTCCLYSRYFTAIVDSTSYSLVNEQSFGMKIGTHKNKMACHVNQF